MRKTKEEFLYYASAQGDLAIVKHLLGEGVDPNILVNGKTPLHAAAESSRRTSRDAVVDALIGAGANINSPDDSQCTPLMIVCNHGRVRCSKPALKLIRMGADVKYVRESDRACAISFAARRASPEVIHALIDAGAPVDGPENDPITPLMIAVQEFNLEAVKVFVQCGANTSRKCGLRWADGKTAEELADQRKHQSIRDFLRTTREGGRPKSTKKS